MRMDGEKMEAALRRQESAGNDEEVDSLSVPAYEQLSQEEKLLYLQKCREAAKEDYKKAFYDGRMIEASIGVPEHPDGFNHGCLCDTCLSYGDS